MQPHPTLFSQIANNLYATEFSRSCEKFPNAKPARGLTEYDHFLAMCFGQLTYRESLRDIVACLNSKPKLLYHLGFRGRMTRTNLAYANKHRDWRLFQSLAETLMRRASRLYQRRLLGPGLAQHGLRAGFFDHFPGAEFVSLGLLRPNQTSRSETSFAALLTGESARLGGFDRRQCGRLDHARSYSPAIPEPTM